MPRIALRVAPILTDELSTNRFAISATFAKGTRMELHPACDLWMRGAKFGTVTRITENSEGAPIVHVRMDHHQVRKIQRFTVEYLAEVK